MATKTVTVKVTVNMPADEDPDELITDIRIMLDHKRWNGDVTLEP